jgi:hypothetical protein
MTCVPLVRPVKSRVVPDGTTTLLMTMVAQEALDLEAREAPLEPEKVQDARLARSGAAVGAGMAAGAAATKEADAAKRLKRVEM